MTMSDSAPQDQQRQPSQPSPDLSQQPATSISYHKRQSTIDPLKAASVPKPPVHCPPSTYIDSSSLATLRGTHQLTLGPDILIHPRVVLNTEQGPVTIGERSVISSKCVVGTATSLSTHKGTLSDSKRGDVEIGDCVHIHSAVQIHPGTTVSSYALLEPNVVISTGCSVGEHTKVCANTTLPPNTAVPPWTVVWGGNGQFQKKRRKSHDSNRMGLEETSRLYSLDRERETGTALLKVAAKQTLSSGSRSKR